MLNSLAKQQECKLINQSPDNVQEYVYLVHLPTGQPAYATEVIH